MIQPIFFIMNQLDICLSPALFEYHRLPEQTVVVIDVIRMSTTICTAFAYGATRVIPVPDIQQALSYRGLENSLIAGERDSHKVEGFDFGNSPFEFMTPEMAGKQLIISTTNGTEAIRVAGNSPLIVASLMNEQAVLQYLVKQKGNILLLCSGWHKKVNLEDSLFAGKLACQLKQISSVEITSDALNMAAELYLQAKDALFEYVINHSYRLKERLHYLEKDVRFCLNPDIQTDIIPTRDNQILIPARL